MARHWWEARSYLNCDCVWGDGRTLTLQEGFGFCPVCYLNCHGGLLVGWRNLFVQFGGSALGEADRLSF